MSEQSYLSNLWTHSAGGQVEKLLPAISAKLKIDVSLSRSEQVFQNNEAAPTKAEIYARNINAIIFSTLNGPLNIEIGIKSNRTRLISNQNQSSQLLVRPTLSIRWKPTPSAIVKVSGEHYQWQSQNRSASSLFLDAQFFYNPPKSDWWLIVQGRNLSDATQLIFTTFSVSQQIYLLQPRFVTLQIGRRF